MSRILRKLNILPRISRFHKPSVRKAMNREIEITGYEITQLRINRSA